MALLLMIRMNYHHQLIMNRRRIPCLDDYLDRVNLLLWPRFKVRQCPLSPSLHYPCASSMSPCRSTCSGSSREQTVAFYFWGLFSGGRGIQESTAVCPGPGSQLSRLAWAQVMLDMQLQSMRAYNPANFGQDPGLHFITQRYALLTTSLLLLNADYQVRNTCHAPLITAPITSVAGCRH